MNLLIQEITKSQLRSDMPNFRPGDSVRVTCVLLKVLANVSNYSEGVVIKRHGVGVSETYTVRKIVAVLVWKELSHYTHLVLLN